MPPTILAVAVTLLAGSAFASPVVLGAPGCSGVFNGIGNVTHFALEAAYKNNTSLIRPLGLVQQTPSLLNSIIAVSDVRTPFTMVSSGIKTLSSSPAVSQPVSSSGYLEFISFTSSSPTEIYCEFFNTSPHGSPYPYPVLAVYGDSDHFSLCPSGQDLMKELVVYKSKERCDDIVVLIVPVK
ncbi:hypothetical protein K488DRAFT_73796 [Vararia minispora EC-137]|uniref:Uncharacterized protein n=1 Tax=Vararia minispora EC-137 TaxID=1314806 RepID=A0ACB8Q9R7_9AGAM|nr:hypothetical protein K488DRAFT_73796 [Vararia minispora EC-137]